MPSPLTPPEESATINAGGSNFYDFPSNVRIDFEVFTLDSNPGAFDHTLPNDTRMPHVVAAGSTVQFSVMGSTTIWNTDSTSIKVIATPTYPH